MESKIEDKIIVINSKERIIELYENKKLIKILNGVNIGTNGLTNNKQEGDLCTPIGTYNLGFSFGTIKNPKFKYPYYEINENMYWVSDSSSQYYNELVEISDTKKENKYPYINQVNEITWNDAEHLIDYPIEYELAIVIEYNMKPSIPKKGSAIFFHIQNKPTTSGCVSTTKENLLYILEWLNNSNGKIIIK